MGYNPGYPGIVIIFEQIFCFPYGQKDIANASISPLSSELSLLIIKKNLLVIKKNLVQKWFC
jgi:hypothetical protein